MASSAQLRASKEQHKPKNAYSKYDDRFISRAMSNCISYLNDRFGDHLSGYQLEHRKSLSYEYMIQRIKDRGLRNDFDEQFNRRTIKPDGGVIILRDINNNQPDKVVLISEVKRQGTNDERVIEGKPRQAHGNAIERLGKNLTGIRAMLNHEDITPFVVFGWGCDFDEEYILGKMSILNEFYSLNKIYVRKQDGNANNSKYSPISMYVKPERWTQDEMLKILKEVAETSLRYHIF